ncbi:MAG: hypothetical protein KAJ19_24655 [Gammaproteobacteria bacterium]|nr:hypothetical protein [Gammaproteobacteria bacterium]
MKIGGKQTGKNITGMVVLLMLVLAFVAVAPGAGAATLTYSFDGNTVLYSDAGYEIINEHAANLTITAARNNSKIFNATSFSDPANTSINVTVQFRNALGVAQDVTGNGTADIFAGTEHTAVPGRYNFSINTSVRPGVYKMYMYADATNSTSGVLIEEGSTEINVFIADAYWTSIWMDEDENVEVGTLSIQLDSVNDRGAVIQLGTGTLNSLSILTPDTITSELFQQIDIQNTGTANDWMFVDSSSSDSGPNVVRLYSRDIIPTPDESVKVSGGVVERLATLKDNQNYNQVVLWDQSASSWLKATDYYIIPQTGRENWFERFGGMSETGGEYSGRTIIVERTTWLSMFSSEDLVFNENIFNRGSDFFSKEFIIGEISLAGKWLENIGDRFGVTDQGNGQWEIIKGMAKLEYPDNFEMKLRDAAVPADLQFRGSMVVSGLGDAEWSAMVAPET